MQVRIYKPTKTTMQSGMRNSKNWLLDFAHDGSRVIEPLMGWTSSQDMYQEVNLKFPSKEEAVAFANANQLTYEIIEPQNKKFIKRSYADNFK